MPPRTSPLPHSRTATRAPRIPTSVGCSAQPPLAKEVLEDTMLDSSLGNGEYGRAYRREVSGRHLQNHRAYLLPEVATLRGMQKLSRATVTIGT